MSVIDLPSLPAGSAHERVTSAIAMASRRTGMDFGYLLGQAKIESSLNPTARAPTSSATGLYQFVDQSWLAVVHDHGAEYGLGWAADAIQRGSNGRYQVADPEMRGQILELRNDPATASLMAAEHASDNREYLQARLDRPVESVDLYLAHFLGVGGASKFLSAHNSNPDANAASLFPAAARANRSIFYDRAGNSRSFADIRALFATKLANGARSAMQTGPSAAPSPSSTPASFGALASADMLADQTVQPADFVRIETARLTQSRQDSFMRPRPETARLAYLMLATFGR